LGISKTEPTQGSDSVRNACWLVGVDPGFQCENALFRGNEKKYFYAGNRLPNGILVMTTPRRRFSAENAELESCCVAIGDLCGRDRTR
jgi:hypothetical protein